MAKPIVFWMLLSLSFLQIQEGNAQEKQIEQRNYTWLGYIQQSRLSNKWGFWFDEHYRTVDLFKRSSFLVNRIGLTYFLKDHIRCTAGYAFLFLFGDRPEDILRYEHRPWQQILFVQKGNGYQLIQRLRFEQRFVQKIENQQAIDEFNFNYRLGYNVLFNIPLKGKTMGPKIPFAIVQEEVMLNMGQRIVYNVFDLNRFFVGIGYPFYPGFTAQLGYMNEFRQLLSGNDYISSHVLRLFVLHQLDFRKKDPKP